MRSKLGRFVSESFVILLSILLAFGIQAWWDERGEHRAFVLELNSVLEEFQANLDEMDAWLAAHRRAAQSADALVAALEARDSDVITITDTLVIGPLLYPTVDPSLGGLRTLLQSGRLALVEDADLRLALASWEDILEDLREEELVGKAITVERLWPALLFRQDPEVVSHLVDLHDDFWREPLRTQPLPADDIRLRVSDELINILIVKKSVARQTIDEFEPIVKLAGEVIAEIRDELAS